MPDEQSMQPMQAMQAMQAMQPTEPMPSMDIRRTINGHEASGHLYAPPNDLGKVTGTERDDAVVQLAAALRTADRAHRAYVAELGQGDVEPAEDWSTWYAEYLLGLR